MVKLAISLEKVQAEAPHLISLVKKTIEVTQNLNLSEVKAAVLAIFDCSGSTDDLYRDGIMQKVADLVLAAGLVFDDDGRVPVAYFGSRVHKLGEIGLDNCHGFIDRHKSPGGGTKYSEALRWIIETAGYSDINLGSSGGEKRLFGLGRKSADPLTAKTKASYPTLAICVTDGEPDNTDVDATNDLLFRMSQLPIFTIFVGVGPHKFIYLHKLDEMEGRLVDNAGFFDSKEADSVTAMLNGILKEFPSYIKDAQRAGLLPNH